MAADPAARRIRPRTASYFARSLRYAITSARSCALSRWKTIFTPGTKACGSASHLSSVSSFQTILEDFSASE